MKRSTLVTLVILVVLVIAYLVMYHSEKQSLTEALVGNFLGVDSGMVNKVEVRHLGQTVDFEKSGDTWNVQDRGKSYPAEVGTVDQIAGLAHGLTVGEIISSNPEKQTLFQVDTTSGNEVTFYHDANPLASIIVGKMGADFQSTYVRKPDSKDVYAATGNFARLFGRPASGYRDKTLLTVDTTQIASVSFKSKDFDYSVGRRDSTWSVVPAKGEAFSPNPQKMSNLLRQLANIRWNSSMPETDTTHVDFAQPAVEVDLQMTDGTTKSLKFVGEGKDNKQYYVQSPAGDETFLVYDYVVNNLAKKPDDLK